MARTGNKLGILVSTAPDQAGFHHGLNLAAAARARGVEVYLYCIDNAVMGLGDTRLQALRASGVRVFACAYAAQRRNLARTDRAVFAGLGVLNDLISATDRFVSFNAPGDSPGPHPSNATCDNYAPPTRVSPPTALPLTHRRMLFIITSDPRTDPRPTEALRIAAGLGAQDPTAVAIYLHGPAIRMLDESAESLVDPESLRLAWPIVQGWHRPVLVERGAAELAGLPTPVVPCDPIDLASLATLVRNSTYVLRF